MHCANLLFSRFFQPNVSLLEKNDSREVIFNIHSFYNSLYSHTSFLIPYTASNLFANNISNYFRLLSPDYKIQPQPDFSDEIIAKTCIYYQGKRR